MSNSYQLLWKASTKYNCTSCKDIIKKSANGYDQRLINLL
jgi:hypothetical protein